jgi:hypothetical protein
MEINQLTKGNTKIKIKSKKSMYLDRITLEIEIC